MMVVDTGTKRTVGVSDDFLTLASSWKAAARCVAGCVLCWDGGFEDERARGVHARSEGVADEVFPRDSFDALCSGERDVNDAGVVFYTYVAGIVSGVIGSEVADGEAKNSADSPLVLAARMGAFGSVLHGVSPETMMKPFDWDDDFTVMKVYTDLASMRARGSFCRQRVAAELS